MIDRRQPTSRTPLTPPGLAGQRTSPSPLPVVSSRQQPPLKEVMQGLDARELEGPTVFDQLFGPPSPP